MRRCVLPLGLAIGLTLACSVYDTSLLVDEPSQGGSGGNGSNGGSGNAGGNGGSGNTSFGGAPQGGSGNTAGTTGGGGGTGGGGAGGGTGGGGTGGTLTGGTGGTGGGGTGGTLTGGTGGTGGGGTGGGGTGGTGGGGTGGTGGGGTGGTGGMPPMPGDPDLVDDFQDLNPQISVRNGRRGSWYGFGTPDPSVGVSNEPPAGGPNPGAYHITSPGFTSTGGVGFAINNDNPYDASAYDRLRFWAKTASGSQLFYVAIPDLYTHPDGGACDENASDTTQCYDDFYFPVTITSTWAQYEVVFADMAQDGWGNPGADTGLSVQAIFAVQLKARIDEPVDLWIDQVELIYGPDAAAAR